MLAACVGRYEVANTIDSRTNGENGVQCATVNYTLNADGTIMVDNSGTFMAPTGPRHHAIGTAEQVSGGKFRVTFSPVPLNIWGSYWIVLLYGPESTGYQVAAVYGCDVKDGVAVTDIWILSRTPVLPEDYSYDSVVAKINSLGLDTTAVGLAPTVQVPNCQYN